MIITCAGGLLYPWRPAISQTGQIKFRLRQIHNNARGIALPLPADDPVEALCKKTSDFDYPPENSRSGIGHELPAEGAFLTKLPPILSDKYLNMCVDYKSR